jgi:hypothetical protein
LWFGSNQVFLSRLLPHAPFSFDSRWQVISQDCTLNTERASTSIQTVRWDKQIPGSTTLDYFVDHAYLDAVIHVQWNAQDLVGVGRYILITVNTIDVSGA